jgi:hypothetical protein
VDRSAAHEPPEKRWRATGDARLMVRLTHLSGSLQGTCSTSPKAVIRIGGGAACDVRFDPALDARVSAYHAEIRFSQGHYVIVDVGSSNGTLLNGKVVRQHRLRSGDRLRFGGQGGPEVRFEIDDSVSAVQAYSNSGNAQPGSQLIQPIAVPAQRPTAMSGAEANSQAMFVMAAPPNRAEATTQRNTGKYWKTIVLSLLTVFAVRFAVKEAVMWEQKHQIERIANKKEAADREIQKIQLQIQLEADPERLQRLEDRLQVLTGKAQAAIGEMEQKDKLRAAEMAARGDELDREIHRILRKFDADTYVVPPIFKERLKVQIDQMLRRRNTKAVVYKRKRQYWPIIVREFSAVGLPEEMGYVAWVESQFNPYAESPAHAKGMWQLMEFRAREMGLRVDARMDERTDVVKSTHAAAKYLANLHSQFGSDSFMLAVASYNKGENGMRRVLHEIAQEPGGSRKEKRDFWRLYRLKALPEDTVEYVPQILAAAIISNNPQKYGLE